MKNKLLIISGIALQCSIVQGQIELGMGAGMSVYRGEIGAHTAASNYVNAKHCNILMENAMILAIALDITLDDLNSLLNY